MQTRGLWARHKVLYLREFLELDDNFWCSEKLSSWNVQKWCFQCQKNKTSNFQNNKQKIGVFWETNRMTVIWKRGEKVQGLFRALKVPEMDVSDHDLSESFGIFEKSFLVAEISCSEHWKILDFSTFSRIWRLLICRKFQLCRRPPHMMMITNQNIQPVKKWGGLIQA